MFELIQILTPNFIRQNSEGRSRPPTER